MKSSEKTTGADVKAELTGSKTGKVLGLFMAVLLATATGCGTTPRDELKHVHYDKNGDGYCDEDNQPMQSAASTYHSGSGFYYLPHIGSGVGSNPSVSPSTTGAATGAGISSGVRGGVGSASVGGGG